MRIVCIAVENYKLTLNKVYNSESESRDFYKLLNDNNIGVRYSKRLFREATREEIAQNVETAAPVRPATPPPPPPLTETDLVNSIQTTGENVTFIDFDRTRKAVARRFTSSESNISCGVKQISGINRQIEEIDSFFDLDSDDFVTIRKALFTACIQKYVRTTLLAPVIFGVMSTNVTGEDEGILADSDLLEVLDALADTTTNQRENPNSGRNIKVWVLSKL